MALNFAGRAPAVAAQKVPPARRAPLVILTCFAAAALAGVLVFTAALHQHKVQAPGSAAAPLVGADHALAAVKPAATLPAPPPIVRRTAQPAAPSAPRDEAPAKPDPAVARARMVAALRQVPHGIITLSVEDDAGAEAYAQRLAEMFREAGWTVDEARAFGSGPPRRGLAAALGVSPADEAVREAFDAVGFRFARPPADAGVIRTPEIYVGTP